MKLPILAGSTRQHSFNRQRAATATAMARASGAEVTPLELSGLDSPLSNAELEARGTPPDLIRLKEILPAHPAWQICSPDYNGSSTAVLKSTIDWASRPVTNHPQWSRGILPFEGKLVGLLSTAPEALGGLRSLSHLNPLLEILQCWPAPLQLALISASVRRQCSTKCSRRLPVFRPDMPTKPRKSWSLSSYLYSKLA